MSDERLKTLYREAQARRASRGEPCGVPLETMIEVLEQQGSEESRHRALAEILANPACREEFELLRAVITAGRHPQSSRRRTAWRWAAAMVAVVGLGWAARTALAPATRDALRGGAAGFALVSPEGAVDHPTVLAWRAVPGAFRYEVSLVDSVGALRYATTTADTQLTLPDSVALAPGAIYRWWVRASLPDGAVRRSNTAAFTPAR
jgi:hypothetical protein